jgi:hypothetical protein
MATLRKRQWKTPTGETRIGWFVDFYDAQDKRQRKQFDSRKEADAYRIVIEEQLRKGLYRPEAERLTVKQGGERFLQHCRERMERHERMTRRNFQVYEGYVRNYIAPDPEWHATKHAKARHQFRYFEKGIGNKTLAQVTVGVVTTFRDDLRAFGVSAPTTRKIIAMLQVMFTYLISLDLMAVNPARDVRVIGRRDEASKQITPPDKEVMRELIALADSDTRCCSLLLPRPAFARASSTRCAGSTSTSPGAKSGLKRASIPMARRTCLKPSRVSARFPWLRVCCSASKSGSSIRRSSSQTI